MRAVGSPDAAAGSRGPDAEVPARRSAAERLAADRAKYVRGSAPPAAPPAAPAPVPAVPEPVARRVIARRPLRPDSLVIYRQKCEFARGPDAAVARGSLGKRGPGPGAAGPAGAAGRPGAKAVPAPEPRPGAPAPAEPGPRLAAPAPRADSFPAPPAPGPRPAAPPAQTPAQSPAPPRPDPRAGSAPVLRGSRRAGLRRSQSDLSARSSAAPAELDAFFQSCGLPPDVVEALGRDARARGARTLSIATSDSGCSRRSDGDAGLQQDELAGPAPGATSVVERNARIIKWLYTCRKAGEGPRPAPQGPAGAPRPGDKTSLDGSATCECAGSQDHLLCLQFV